MTNHIIRLRKAKLSDCDNVLSWRNHSAVREGSIHSSIITKEEHTAWFERMLRSEDTHFLIAEVNDSDPLGTLRFDINKEKAEISIYLTPNYIGKGYGLALLEEGEQWLRRHHPPAKIIEARILASNQRSQKTFKNAGYEEYLALYRKELTHE
ncbi:MAG: N-acetyltransferase family protein [Candidatus Berkiella sp.]